MSNADVSGVLRRGVVVREVDAWSVILVDRNWSADELARDRLNDVDESQHHPDDHG